MQASADWFLRNSKDAIALIVAKNRILLRSMTDEIAGGNPVRCHERDWPLGVRPDQEKPPPALGAVIFQNPLRKWLPVICAPPQKRMEIDIDNVVLQRVAWVHTPDMRAEGALEALHVVCIRKFIVAIAIRSESGIVTLWCEEERRPSPPAADHFCGDQLFFFC